MIYSTTTSQPANVATTMQKKIVFRCNMARSAHEMCAYSALQESMALNCRVKPPVDSLQSRWCHMVQEQRKLLQHIPFVAKLPPHINLCMYVCMHAEWPNVCRWRVTGQLRRHVCVFPELSYSRWVTKQTCLFVYAHNAANKCKGQQQSSYQCAHWLPEFLLQQCSQFTLRCKQVKFLQLRI